MERDKETLIEVFLDHLTNHPKTSILIFLFVTLLLITVIPALLVTSSMDYYNNSTEAGMHVSLSSNLIIAFVTLIYVVLTRELVLESRKMRELQTAPNVYLFIEPRNEHNDITDLFIQNFGMGAAYNIQFNLLSDFIYYESKERSKIYFASEAIIIKDGIKYLAPTQKKRLFSTTFNDVKELNLQNNLGNYLKIYVTYQDNIRRKKYESFDINFYEVPANGMSVRTTSKRNYLEELKE
jgi:hypothetical protein